MIEIASEKCTGCGACIAVCPFGAITLVNGKATIGDACNMCGACVEACSFEAIKKEENAKHKSRPTSHDDDAGKADDGGVWVVAEVGPNGLRPVVHELLGEGRKLAERLGCELSCVLLGHNVEKFAGSLAAADVVYLADHPSLEKYTTQRYSQVVKNVIAEHKPAVVLFGATINGRDLAPRVAAALGVGLTADCTALEIDDKNQLVQTRPAFGGNIMASIVSRARPQMATVRPGVMKKSIIAGGKIKAPTIVKLDVPEIQDGVSVVDVVSELSTSEKKIEEAEIIVSVGRGISSKESIRMAEELAHTLGAAVGGSRAVVDAGWMPHHQQVGQTGKTVAPKLYIALGISGAVQHLVGMQTSDTIIAINRDPEAPIFGVATLGIVGDIFEIVPKLIELIKQQRSSSKGG